MEGQDFDPTDMIVTATYSDGSTKEVIDYTIVNGSSLKKGQTSVEISYTEENVTKTTTQPITVTHEHVWDEGKTTKEPTCLEKGEITYTCTICSETRKEDIAETGHKYENGICINCGENLFTEESKYYIMSSNLIGINPNTSLNALTLTFTVNEDVEDGTTQISTTAIEVTDINNKDYTLEKSEKIIKIENVNDNTVEEKPSQDEPSQDTPEQDEEEDLPSNNTDTDNQLPNSSTDSENNKIDNTATQTKLPNTGYRNIIVMVIVIAIVTTIAYIQIKRNSFK